MSTVSSSSSVREVEEYQKEIREAQRLHVINHRQQQQRAEANKVDQWVEKQAFGGKISIQNVQAIGQNHHQERKIILPDPEPVESAPVHSRLGAPNETFHEPNVDIVGFTIKFDFYEFMKIVRTTNNFILVKILGFRIEHYWCDFSKYCSTLPTRSWIEKYEAKMGDGRHELSRDDVRRFTCRLSARGMNEIMADYFALRNYKSKGKTLDRNLLAFSQDLIHTNSARKKCQFMFFSTNFCR